MVKLFPKHHGFTPPSFKVLEVKSSLDLASYVRKDAKGNNNTIQEDDKTQKLHINVVEYKQEIRKF
jgi:hypothetical protein